MARGGQRPGAGRKSRYGVDTTTVRIPTVLKEEVLAFVDCRMAELEAENTQAAEPEPKPIEAWRHASGRCQAETVKGQRCGNGASTIATDTLPDGRRVEYSVCALHGGQIRRGLPVRPHRTTIEMN